MSRAIHRGISLLALVVWVGATIGTTVFPHTGGFDIDYADEAWISPHPTTQFEAVHPPVSGDHCVVCHLQRMGSRTLAENIGVLVTPHVMVVGAITPGQKLSTARDPRVPARAPPFSLL
jgi:hypothetical protein